MITMWNLLTSIIISSSLGAADSVDLLHEKIIYTKTFHSKEAGLIVYHRDDPSIRLIDEVDQVSVIIEKHKTKYRLIKKINNEDALRITRRLLKSKTSEECLMKFDLNISGRFLVLSIAPKDQQSLRSSFGNRSLYARYCGDYSRGVFVISLRSARVWFFDHWNDPVASIYIFEEIENK